MYLCTGDESFACGIFSSLLINKFYDAIKCRSDLRRFVDHIRLAIRTYVYCFFIYSYWFIGTLFKIHISATLPTSAC